MLTIRLPILIITVVIMFALFGAERMLAAGPPPNPTVYSGKVTVGGMTPADSVTSMQIYCDDNRVSSRLCEKGDLGKWVDSEVGNRQVCHSNCIYGKVGTYTSDGGIIKNGNYVLTVGPPDAGFAGMAVKFYFNDIVMAEQGETFNIQSSMNLRSGYTLTFPDLPTPTPTPTNTPTPTPVIPKVGIYSGRIFSAGGNIPEGATLVARIGSYTSEGIQLNGDIFKNLIVDPQDPDAVGQEIQFFLAGVLSRTQTKFKSGDMVSELDLVFVGLPEATATAVPPTVVPPTVVPPTAVPPTVVPPTTIPPTVVPPTAVPPTVVPPTAVPPTVVPPTAVPPTVVVPPTAVPLANLSTPTPTPRVVHYEESRHAREASEKEQVESSGGGGCNKVGEVTKLNGAANALMMIAPLLMVAGYRGWRRRQK